MSDTELDDGIKRTPAEDSPWGRFLLKTIELDMYNNKPRGWHWFWGIYHLQNDISEHGFYLKRIIDVLPDEHWLKIEEKNFHTTSSTGRSVYLRPQERGKEHDSVRILIKDFTTEDATEIKLSNILFDSPINISGFIFPIYVSFQDSKFSYDVRFNKTCFYGSADFIFTKFLGSSNFNNARFLSNVTFDNAIFSRPADFHSTTFADDAFFYETNFSKDADFTEATFARIASFDKIKFDEFAIFLDVIFSRGATFTNAIFSHRAVFDQVKITGHTSFRKAEFKKYPPSFHKVDMHSDIIWDKIKWPILNKKSDIDIVDQNKNAYENLASHMKKLDKHDDQHFFYRQETSCQRHLEPLLISPFYLLYEKFANYGYGIERALLWWFGHIVFGTLLLFIHRFFSPIGKWYDDLGCSFGISFSNAHSFLFFNAGPLLKCKEHLDKIYFFNTIWFFQTILGAIFLFLLLLTLRIRFRLK